MYIHLTRRQANGIVYCSINSLIRIGILIIIVGKIYAGLVIARCCIRKQMCQCDLYIKQLQHIVCHAIFCIENL